MTKQLIVFVLEVLRGPRRGVYVFFSGEDFTRRVGEFQAACGEKNVKHWEM